MKFAGIGLAGFCVDAGLLALLVDQGLGPFVARFVSFPVAVAATFALNRALTFGDIQLRRKGRTFVDYAAVQALGALTNMSVYVALVHHVDELARAPVLALAAAAAVSLLVTYTGSRWVFERGRA